MLNTDAALLLRKRGIQIREIEILRSVRTKLRDIYINIELDEKKQDISRDASRSK